MSASLKTTNYELGIYAPNDVTSWLTDFNGNMNKIDAQMKVNANGVQGNVGNINALTERVSTAENAIEQIENEYASVIEKLGVNKLMFTPSSNVKSGDDTYVPLVNNILGVITGVIIATIEKTGDQLSAITLPGESAGSIIPIHNIAGNIFDLETVSSPTRDNITIVGSTINNVVLNSDEENAAIYPIYAYYNGTNTIIGFILGSNRLVSTYKINSTESNFSYNIN